MSTIADLGNGIGYIYVTDPTTTTDIKVNIINDEAGARAAKIYGVQASNLATNLQGVATTTYGTPSGTGSITNITINSRSQITSAIPFTVATTAAEVATLVAAEVNATTPVSGDKYTAIAVGAIVYYLAPTASGDNNNGHVLTTTISANLTATDTNVAGGSDANAYAYDNKSGYRFFLDATAAAAAGSFTGSQVEITDFICPKDLVSGIPIVSTTVTSGVATIERVASISYVGLYGEGGAPDTLTDINPVNFADGDIIVVYGLSAAQAITINNTGNIVTQGAVSFVTDTLADNIILRRSNGSWYEVSKSITAVPTAVQFRTASFPLLSTSGYGSAALTAADNTTVTLTANTDKQRQVVTGTVTLETGNYTIAVSTTDAVAGDEFIIEYNALVTNGSYDTIIGGITLSDADALTGGIVVKAYYSGSAWQYSMYKDYNQAARVQTADVADDAVTVAKVSADLTYEIITVPVSFAAGATASNSIEMPYPGTVSKITSYSTSAIGYSSTITPKNNAGTVMTGGTITFAAGDPVNTGYTSTPSANNTFVAGDILTFQTQSTTLGSGTALVSIKITRS